MATKTAAVTQTGVNNRLIPAEDFNVVATDTLLPGIVGGYFNTSGVAPATGSFAVNAQGSPNMTVAVSAGQAYVSATPTGGTAQNIRVNMTSSEDVVIAANSTGSTRYDFVYVKVDADKLNNPAADGTDVVTLTTQRSTTQDADSNGALANALLLAVVTVANGATSISNSNITDRRLPVNSQTDGWQQANETWTYASATTITVPTGATFKYSVGDKVKLMQSGAWKYFYITGVAATTLTITGGSDYTLANATIAAPCFSKRVTPVGFPQSFNFTPTWTSSGSAPSIGNGTFTGSFSVIGKECFVKFKFVGGSTTTWGTGSYYINLPLTGYTGIAANDGFVLGGYAEDAGVKAYTVAATRMLDTSKFMLIMIDTASSTVSTWQQTSPFTWSTGDYWSATGHYPIA